MVTAETDDAMQRVLAECSARRCYVAQCGNPRVWVHRYCAGHANSGATLPQRAPSSDPLVLEIEQGYLTCGCDACRLATVGGGEVVTPVTAETLTDGQIRAQLAATTGQDVPSAVFRIDCRIALTGGTYASDAKQSDAKQRIAVAINARAAGDGK